jgi:hypothetical protein
MRRSLSMSTVADGAVATKTGDGARRLAPLAAYGVTVASVDYRLAPRATFPDQLYDIKAAVRWLRGNGGRLGLRIDRLGIWGASAGAYLGSLLALTAGIDKFEGAVGKHLDQSSAVQAVVHWFGQSDLIASGSRTDVEARLLPFAFEAGLLGVTNVADATGKARELSLLSWVSAGRAPVPDRPRRPGSYRFSLGGPCPLPCARPGRGRDPVRAAGRRRA